ncbi:CHASE3 domain-containing protein [Aeromonas salmonicida]|uniref:CHASE3 domain-containing protein n=1 Tax=Aeromonas salmonicida TaxID=645 RepID=UPI00240E4F01|nr:OmpH family outer membrane protein [Aeromonas salmonicida]WFC15426.1 OmpH family outer membrane protein [Aeromonas salmonicida]
MNQTQPKAPEQGGFDTSRLLNLMSDIDGQPDWRTMANRACAYYDGDQLPPEVVKVLEERGQPITIHNLIAPTIDGVLGMEAKSRTDLMVIADDHDDELEQLAEAVNAEYADMCRLGGLDRARGEAYGGQIKTGIGWVEVRRNDDPFGPRYRFSNVPRDEVYWDWHSREPDLSDNRWLMRRRWVDLDEAKTMFPSKVEALNWGVNDWDGFVSLNTIEGMDPNLASAFEEWGHFDRKQVEWCSRNRDRVLLQVVYYRTYTMRQVLMLDSGRALEYDKSNQLHLAAVAMGRAKLERCPVASIRESWFVGPHHLVDRPCSAPHNMYPLVPFWGYRKDRSGEPYGLIARAMPAQDEVNLRRIKLTFLLQAKRVIMDKDATNMSRDQVLEQVERPDGYIELNPDRANKTSVSDAFKVEQDFNVAAQQFQVMQDSVKLIQDTMGVYAAFLGQGTTGQSGVAISNLVEQGATTLSEINDNYRMGCQQVGQLALSYLLEDMASKRNHKVTVNRDDPRRRKAVVINVEQEDGKLTNDVTRLRAHIALAPIQQTAAYKQQLAERMTQAMSQLPPEAAGACFDLLVELMDVPRKAEFVERVRKALNIQKDPEEMTDEERAAAEQQAQQQQMEQELAMREMQAKLAELEGKAAKWQAEAQRITKLTDSIRFEDALKQAQTGKTLQEMERLAAEQQTIQGEQAAIQAQLLGTIQQQIDAITL